MPLLQLIKESLIHFAFPHVCAGCGTDVLDRDSLLCLECVSALPKTEFQFYPNNPVEKLFWGRLAVTHAMATYYFTKESLVQHLMHRFKYKGNVELGRFMGRLMGAALQSANRFRFVDALIPLPLHTSKEKRRGFNQAEVLCRGLADMMNLPVLTNVVRRTIFTESQTKKNRTERWKNMEGRFEVSDREALRNKHVLLVDDVVTTGATLEACGKVLLEVENLQLSIATLCFSGH